MAASDRSLNRRTFLAELAAVLTAAASASRLVAAEGRKPRILLRSSWQTVNIGDIGHTPGVLRLLGEYLPEAEVTLWPSNIANGVEELLRRNFPKLHFALNPAEVTKAFTECDFLLHGSGASFVAQKHAARWHRETGKPFGIYGITLSAVNAEARELLDAARFVFFRDSVSLKFAWDQGLKCPVMEFGPDGAFGVNLRNDAAAESFLAASGLEPGKFLCAIPRLRYTPYWLIRHKALTAEDDRKHARNEAMQEHDHAPLRAAISAVVRETALKVLVCPEDESQMAIGKTMLVDRLPDDVKARVVWREKYWLTDEALSTYVRSAGLFGLEMHSPIMCIGNGVPAIVCRFQEQTSKGIMWRDIGLGDWLFDMDSPDDVARIVPTVLALAKDPSAAKAKAAQAREFVEQRQRATMAILKRNLQVES
jgi:polysaccharide pyruvyl transferase WcaK-like protein